MTFNVLTFIFTLLSTIRTRLPIQLSAGMRVYCSLCVCIVQCTWKQTALCWANRNSTQITRSQFGLEASVMTRSSPCWRLNYKATHTRHTANITRVARPVLSSQLLYACIRFKLASSGLHGVDMDSIPVMLPWIEWTSVVCVKWFS